jgi:hypothetical protein
LILLVVAVIVVMLHRVHYFNRRANFGSLVTGEFRRLLFSKKKINNSSFSCGIVERVMNIYIFFP